MKLTKDSVESEYLKYVYPLIIILINRSFDEIKEMLCSLPLDDRVIEQCWSLTLNDTRTLRNMSVEADNNLIKVCHEEEQCKNYVWPPLVIVTGGSKPFDDRPNIFTSVELLDVLGNRKCSLPDLPYRRYGHTQVKSEIASIIFLK